eukprot:CAMPEP_0194278470 /NCGR_PEP_ID=MMETSP0169-20130528/11251_1 /TAXON_ID=218684 /ORGANISM="Corethron pennatum, Strain L29A3" /LENGTH=487 /DNA_ID=CAMNT_0039022663 /DNA_START=36 /DNA_END=1499 /DNA_ORIENTATION=+
MTGVRRLLLSLLLAVPTAVAATPTSTSGVSVLPPAPAASVRRARDLRRVAPPSPRGGGGVQLPTGVAAASFYVAFDAALRAVFSKTGIKFPSMVAGCVGLFAAMAAAEAIVPGAGDAASNALTPGSALLAKWMPAFFVPGLVMLPTAPSLGSAGEVIKVLSVVVLGFFFSLYTTAFSVLGLRKLQGADVSIPGMIAGGSGPAAKPYSADTAKFLTSAALILFPISIGCSLKGGPLEAPARTAFLGAATLCTYVYGARLPPSFVKIVHPLMVSTALTLLAIRGLAAATGATFDSVLGAYKCGKMWSADAGAGDVLLHLLGPSVQAFSIAMYGRRKLMASNFATMALATLVSAGGGLFATAAFVRLIRMASGVARISVLPRNVTTALAIAISQILEGNIAITASVVVLTGVFAATVGAAALDAVKIKDPITRGLAIGSAGQGLGVASFMGETDAFPFAAIAMICTAIGATCLVSVPAIKDALLAIAGGN